MSYKSEAAQVEPTDFKIVWCRYVISIGISGKIYIIQMRIQFVNEHDFLWNS